MMMRAVLLLLASDSAVAVAPHPSAAVNPSRLPITIANLPLRAVDAAQVNRCLSTAPEPPRPWTPEKDVFASPANACRGEDLSLSASTGRLRAPGAYVGGGDNDAMRLASAALPYLRAVVGGGAMAVALTGRLMLARGSRPELNLDVGRGRAGATSYVIVPEGGGHDAEAAGPVLRTFSLTCGRRATATPVWRGDEGFSPARASPSSAAHGRWP